MFSLIFVSDMCVFQVQEKLPFFLGKTVRETQNGVFCCCGFPLGKSQISDVIESYVAEKKGKHRCVGGLLAPVTTNHGNR